MTVLHAQEILLKIERTPKVFVAAISGHALGGGFEIALACDFRFAAEGEYRIGLPEVRQHRLKRLDKEEKAWAEELRKREQVLPQLQPVILLRVEVGNG